LANSKFARFCFKLKHADTLSGKAHPHDVQAACKTAILSCVVQLCNTEENRIQTIVKLVSQ